MRVLVLGASGFIGARLASAIAAAGHQVRAGARDPDAARRRAPTLDWVKAEFAELTRPEAWAPLLDGVDVVVNCVGVLQDGAGENVRAAHDAGPAALFSACEAAGVGRLVHLSAVGADEAADTPYARSKQAAEARLMASGLDWIILRPSLVIDRGVYGGTGLMRGLAAFPGFIPLVGGDQVFRPVAMDDLCAVVVAMLSPEAPGRRRLDLAGPQAVTLTELLKALRGWLGLPSAPVLPCPRWLARPVLTLGDLAGWLGWPSPLRTTALRQMDHDVSGQPADAADLAGITPRSLTRWLAETPATVQDRWHARLYFVRPLAVIVLGLFWIGTGAITLGPGWTAAVGILTRAGFGDLSVPVAFWGGVFDLVLGGLLWVRSWTRRTAILMVLATIGYLVAGTLFAPELWIDPLGPWLKVLPMMALCLFVAGSDDRR